MKLSNPLPGAVMDGMYQTNGNNITGTHFHFINRRETTKPRSGMKAT